VRRHSATKNRRSASKVFRSVRGTVAGGVFQTSTAASLMPNWIITTAGRCASTSFSSRFRATGVVFPPTPALTTRTSPPPRCCNCPASREAYTRVEPRSAVVESPNATIVSGSAACDAASDASKKTVQITRVRGMISP